jgi:hypothetical protein
MGAGLLTAMNMKKHYNLYRIALGALIFISSCKTYYIPVDSFKQQFSGWRTARLKAVTTRGPVGEIVSYDTYPIDYIECVDKSGKPALLKNGPSLEIRFTDIHNKKTIFYFDRMSVNDSTVSGARSRILSNITKTIPLNTVKLIEIQDGGKRYRYVN